MFKKKFLILELDPFEAEFYHLPDFVPYFEKDQKKLDKEGFSWQSSVNAMKALIEEDYCDEYKPYKSFIKKWEFYKKLNENIENENWSDAQKNINQILAIDLLDPSAYFNLGIVARAQGEILKAEQAYKKGLELVNHKTPFLAGLAKTYEDALNYDDAMYYWFEVFDLSYGNEEIQSIETLSEVFYQSVEALLRLQVFDKSFNDIDKDSINCDQSIKEIYDKELENIIPVDLVRRTKFGAEFIPGDNFLRMMRRNFMCNYNYLEKLNKLGVKLVYHKFTDLAVRVFERVYELSYFKRA